MFSNEYNCRATAEVGYFVLSIGHGAVKCPLLKLQVVHVQLLCQHAA